MLASAPDPAVSGGRIRLRWLAIALVGAGLEGCLVGIPWTQTVDISIVRDGEPLTGQAFRLTDNRSADPCASPGLEGTTDSRGVFTGRRRQWSTAWAFVDVIGRFDTLCLHDAGEWRNIWELPYGPAPTTLALRCDVARAARSKHAACEVSATSAR
jgi:hypothetical protein